MFFKKRKTASLIIGMEVCKESVHLAVGQLDDDGTVNLETRTQIWRESASSLHSEAGRDELADTLKELLADYKCQGAPVYLALNGDYCVTRVVTGAADRVRRELSQLQQRTALYLSLGHGRKAVGGSIRSIDARHEHALLAVVNQRTLDAICDVFHRLGLRLVLVEPSLVSLCRIVGRIGGDADGPALIINLNKTGTEIGITHAGRPLLDYRPPIADTNQQIASVVIDHLDRLQRYCSRYVSFAQGKLRSAFICGDWQAVDAVGAVLEESNRLTVQGIEPTSIEPLWKFGGEVPGSELNSALGACSVGLEHADDHTGPNLMEGIVSGGATPYAWPLVKTIWPIAAALMIALAAWGVTMSTRHGNAQLAQELASYRDARRAVKRYRREIGRHRGLIREISAINRALPNRQWHKLAERIGQCLPGDVWLDSVAIDPNGQLAISGASFTENGVFELIHWLEAHPQLDQVALRGTQPTRMDSGPATRFDVYCDFADSPDNEEEHDNDG